MPFRIPRQTIVVVRDGKRVVPEIGKKFEFTSDEIKEINAINREAIRRVVNEDEPAQPAAKIAAPTSNNAKTDAPKTGSSDSSKNGDGAADL